MADNLSGRQNNDVTISRIKMPFLSDRNSDSLEKCSFDLSAGVTAECDVTLFISRFRLDYNCLVASI